MLKVDIYGRRNSLWRMKRQEYCTLNRCNVTVSCLATTTTRKNPPTMMAIHLFLLLGSTFLLFGTCTVGVTFAFAPKAKISRNCNRIKRTLSSRPRSWRDCTHEATHALFAKKVHTAVISKTTQQSRNKEVKSPTSDLYHLSSDCDWKDNIMALTHSVPRLTILLPAFNEQDRITSTLTDYTNYLQKSEIWGGTSAYCPKILIVNDGSTDNTTQVVSTFYAKLQQHDDYDVDNNTDHDDDGCSDTCTSFAQIECLSLKQNLGKGAAIAKGIEVIVHENKTDIILIADADGSGNISSSFNDMVTVLYKSLVNYHSNISTTRTTGNNPPYPSSSSSSSSNNNNHNNHNNNPICNENIWNSSPCIVVGNRGYDGVLSWKRQITRWGFRTCVQLICGNLNCQDTQCGLKLLNVASSKLYKDLYLQRWTHDVEVLFRAKCWSIPVAEVDVEWQDKEGSKLISKESGGLVGISIIMLWEILLMRMHYLFLLFKADRSKTESL